MHKLRTLGYTFNAAHLGGPTSTGKPAPDYLSPGSLSHAHANFKSSIKSVVNIQNRPFFLEVDCHHNLTCLFTGHLITVKFQND